MMDQNLVTVGIILVLAGFSLDYLGVVSSRPTDLTPETLARGVEVE